ncbi:MAG: ABC transporter substrate-binding protein [Pseudomonadota bacterium]
MTRHRHLPSIIGAAAALALAAGSAAAQQTSIKFTLDFTLQGPQGAFFLAHERGYYAAEGVNLTALDAGRGSSDTVNRVASGAYDMGFGDLNALIEFNAKNPGRESLAVLMIYDQAPFSIVTLKSKNIARPADLVGRNAAAPSFDTPFRLFALFAKANNFDPARVNWSNVAPPLREPMLARGETDAISGFSFTAVLALKGLGVPEANIQTFMYKDFGVDLYSNAVIAAPALVQSNPGAVKGFVQATIRGWQDAIADPAAAVAALKKKDPLINDVLELERLKLAIATSVLTGDVKKSGFGGVRPERLQRNIDLVTEGFNLERKVAAGQVFTDRFLPPAAERRLTR